jgi:hypothetical protein
MKVLNWRKTFFKALFSFFICFLAEFLLPENAEQYNLDENYISSLADQLNPKPYITNYLNENQPFFKVNLHFVFKKSI